MHIEAICAVKGLHPEYLVRMSHKEVMTLGAAHFAQGEVLTVISSLEHIEAGLTSLRYAHRALEDLKQEQEKKVEAKK